MERNQLWLGPTKVGDVGEYDIVGDQLSLGLYGVSEVMHASINRMRT